MNLAMSTLPVERQKQKRRKNASTDNRGRIFSWNCITKASKFRYLSNKGYLLTVSSMTLQRLFSFNPRVQYSYTYFCRPHLLFYLHSDKGTNGQLSENNIDSQLYTCLVNIVIETDRHRQFI